jgi:Bacterial DNA polymerase III alpha NTPase domain
MMIKNKFGELIFNEDDLFKSILQGHQVTDLTDVYVDTSINLEKLINILENPGTIPTWRVSDAGNITVNEYDATKQQQWFMPDDYMNLDIAEYVLGLCKNEQELQRCGHELLMFQERDLFNLLRYLKYLVDVMQENQLIWGVGRGSSVASYVLYKLGVHRIDSMFYDLDPSEFLR